jgi:predicted Ser/Thr protein kinase/membrane protein YdbS with pleckstrin-like domain
MPAFDFVLAGRYRLIAPLGEGGMAAVYCARDLRLNREVAVKVLRDELTRDPDFLGRFEREAQVVASLSHPNIVPVYDVGEEQGSRFIVMEYVRGRTLKEAIEAGGPFSADRAVEIMLCVLDALTHAHERGLIHRDVKPQNILIAPSGDARLADFGIAHLVDSSSTRTAAILGSAHYLSPEQARGAEATPASDVYACGIVLFEALAGYPPFNGPNALAIANHHVHTPPPSIRELRGDVPAAVANSIERALAKDPAARYPSAAEFAAALQPRALNPSDTIRQPLDLDQTQAVSGTETQLLVPAAAYAASGARPAARPVPALLLHRSARKVAAAAVLLALVVAALADLAQFPVAGRHLPAYPGPPYALVPALLALVLVVYWLHVRSWSYRMDGNAAVLQWGLLTHHRFGVPVRSITTLELQQNLIDRVLRVGTIQLSARDQHGTERRLVLEDLPHPRESYEELLRFLGRTLRQPAPREPAST